MNNSFERVWVGGFAVLILLGLLFAGIQVQIHFGLPGSGLLLSSPEEGGHDHDGHDHGESAGLDDDDHDGSADHLPMRVTGLPVPRAFNYLAKYTHIHLFGMNILVFLIGFLLSRTGLGDGKKALIIGAGYIGIIGDLLSLWLKVFLDPRWIWGSDLFGGILLLSLGAGSLLALKEAIMGRKE